MTDDLPELPEPALFAPQMITEDAYTADQMRAYVESDRARGQLTLSEQDLVDLYDDLPGNASFRTFRQIANYVLAALSLKGAAD